MIFDRPIIKGEPGKISVQELSVYLYFISILILTYQDNTLTTLLYYGAAFACLVSLKLIKKRTEPIVIALLLTGMAFGMLNIGLVGNLNPILLFIFLMGFYSAQLFMHESVPAKVFLNILWVWVIYILLMIALKGLGNPVFTYVSNNYISVYLFSPTVLYYIKSEMDHEEIRIFPAAVVWVMCVLGTSRSGLITATLMLGALLVYKYYMGQGSHRKILLLGAAFFGCVLVVAVLLPLVLERFSDYYIVDRFLSMGLTSNARLRMWSEYIALLDDKTYFLFGAPMDQVYWAARFYEGNLHNSFFFVHAYLGIVGFVGMVLLMAYSAAVACKKRNWVFLIMFGTFCLRAFTDHVFGCNRLTPVFLCMLLYPFLYKWKADRSEKDTAADQ